MKPLVPGIPDAAFHLPAHVFVGHPSWIQHIPFLAGVLQMQRPEVFVELGVHSGNSYFAGCNTVSRLGLSTRCVAIDTWQGDDHAGFYGEDVFERVQRINGEYPFSELLRSAFADAIGRFQDGSIDLIHFDGRHYHRDIKADFESWLPKLSDRAIALLHDVHVYSNDFGVAAYWSELKERYPTFEFFHGHGLGVVLIGDDHEDDVVEWFASLADRASYVRNAFYRLGEAVQDHFELLQRKASGDQAPQLEAVRAQNIELRADMERLEAEYRRLTADVDVIVTQYHSVIRERDDLDGLLSELRVGILESERNTDVVHDREGLVADLEQLLGNYRSAARERDELRESVRELEVDRARIGFELMRLESRRSVRISLALAARLRWWFRLFRRSS